MKLVIDQIGRASGIKESHVRARRQVLFDIRTATIRPGAAGSEGLEKWSTPKVYRNITQGIESLMVFFDRQVVGFTNFFKMLIHDTRRYDIAVYGSSKIRASPRAIRNEEAVIPEVISRYSFSRERVFSL